MTVNLWVVILFAEEFSPGYFQHGDWRLPVGLSPLLGNPRHCTPLHGRDTAYWLNRLQQLPAGSEHGYTLERKLTREKCRVEAEPCNVVGTTGKRWNWQWPTKCKWRVRKNTRYKGWGWGRGKVSQVRIGKTHFFVCGLKIKVQRYLRLST